MMRCPALPFAPHAGTRASGACRRHPITRLAMAAVVFVVAACAGTLDQTAPGKSGTKAGAPPARYNLAGYPPAFRAGFNAACDAARRHVTVVADPTRYAADPQYRQGWKDGASICKTP